MRAFRVAMVAACPFPAAFASAGLIRELSLALKESGHDVHVVTYHLGDRQFPTSDLPIHRIPNVPGYRKLTSGIAPAKPLLDILLTKTLLNTARRYRFDVIHAHNYEAPPAGYFVRGRLGIPVVYHAHNTMIHELPSYFSGSVMQSAARWAGRLLDRQIPKRADHIITVSREQTDYLESEGIRRDRMTLMPPCIGQNLFVNGNRHQIRLDLGLQDFPVILYTGGLQPYQNCEILIDVLRECMTELPEIRLLILARSESARLRELAVAAHIEDRIHLIHGQGLQFERDCLAAADVGVIPRTSCIGFPVKLLNYTAAGLPVVCFEGLNKGFINETEILAVPVGDVRAMASAIVRLILNESQRSTLAQAARVRLESEHSWAQAVQTLSIIYESVASMRVTR